MKRLGILLLLMVTACLLGTGCGSGRADKTLAAAGGNDDPGMAPFGEPMVLSFITIGKGDAFLLEIPEWGYCMIDTGKKKDYGQISRLLHKKGAASLKGVFLSHGHKDHAGGLKKLLKEFPTETVYVSSNDTSSYKEIDAAAIAEDSGAKLYQIRSGEEMSLGNAAASFWIPGTEDKKEPNNNSVIMRIVYGDTAFLMMGDAEHGEEAALLSSSFPLKADVLKLGHHGENNASSMELLKEVSPSMGIICGNREENPDSVNPYVTARLKELGITPCYSLNSWLAVDFISDGITVKVEEIPDTDH